ncbi:hypothetical protein [Nocardioides lianchengensis]|uniref:Uncharacterized protein n=1 Tax=Nocardioides lianchengensis TaxID=1045774 RepID=A0A1G7ABQ3_9ACTN|nr:hypothetical protein [Nocardioides lianchengensis]NYG13641.1 hypothetical protein [Nocardioides lianchengensis]SDE12229.1 hypothetical protein SAMN05421872_11555 [Nocardioides lianchengensis]
MADDPRQIWELVVDGHAHLVEVHGSVNRRIEWYVDGELVGTQKSTEDKIRVKADDEERTDLGSIGVWFSGMGKPRRATYFDPGQDGDLKSLAGVGGVDLVPEPGSPAAAYEDRVRAHPTRYALIATVGGVAKVVLPILLAVLAARVAVSIPWPDWNLPSVPTPDLPSIPTPDLPSIPWPDLPDVSVPGWVEWLLDKVKYVWPIVLAVVIARGEIRRRRKQDELREQRRGEASGRASDSTDSTEEQP